VDGKGSAVPHGDDDPPRRLGGTPADDARLVERVETLDLDRDVVGRPLAEGVVLAEPSGVVVVRAARLAPDGGSILADRQRLATARTNHLATALHENAARRGRGGHRRFQARDPHALMGQRTALQVVRAHVAVTMPDIQEMILPRHNPHVTTGLPDRARVLSRTIVRINGREAKVAARKQRTRQ